MQCDRSGVLAHQPHATHLWCMAVGFMPKLILLWIIVIGMCLFTIPLLCGDPNMIDDVLLWIIRSYDRCPSLGHRIMVVVVDHRVVTRHHMTSRFRDGTQSSMGCGIGGKITSSFNCPLVGWASIGAPEGGVGSRSSAIASWLGIPRLRQSPVLPFLGLKFLGALQPGKTWVWQIFLGLHTGRHEPAGRRPAASAERHIHTL